MSGPREHRSRANEASSAADDVVGIDLTTCAEPDCGLPAEIRNRFVLESTSGPVEHVTTSCVGRHHLRMPSAMLLGADR